MKTSGQLFKSRLNLSEYEMQKEKFKQTRQTSPFSICLITENKMYCIVKCLTILKKDTVV